ncbi:aminotransferase-like domain-containing protein [Oceanospirillum sediminis]|uniref:PLP-dependent aminotransferase family protein n=1 Tax=Oceanospirillum sediminis TaxID=2760088 RepID=A0A839IRQ7_9GAMM|nr:PLP-dependent aminotransferase family protein [Oceanospirillum sediminis]MBB1487638.1 PLP-dependent aminotransferase family protein [Oceanospirillum sediminis]
MPSPRYKQLVDRFAGKIRSGELPPGEKLPPHRTLAAAENMALVTASRVYAELEKMGLVSCETGRGTFVRETALPTGHGVDQKSNPPDTLDLNFNSPLVEGQSELFRDALKKLASSGDLETLLHYQPHAGRPTERQAISHYLADKKTEVSAEQIFITNGTQHALSSVLLTLFNPGDVIAVDAQTYSGFKVLAQLHHIELVAIPVTPQGPNLNALRTLCQARRVRGIYTMPTLHNPLGWVLDLECRKQLAAIAEQSDLIIIEDGAYDYLANDAPARMMTLAPDRSVYVSGFSKNVATGLRVGYLVTPVKWCESFERCIRATSWNTPALNTALITRWLQDGTVARLEQEKRQDAGQRQDIARQVLQEHHIWSHPNAYTLWLPLPEGVRADQVVHSLLNHHIAVATAEPFTVGPSVPQAIRIALASIPLPQLQAALVTINQVIEDHYCGITD